MKRIKTQENSVKTYRFIEGWIPLFYIAWSARFLLLFNLANSTQISIIFSTSFFSWVAIKINFKYIFVVFSNPILPFVSISWVIALVVIVLLLPFGEFFHTSVCRWFLTGVWVTASFLKSPGFFSVISPILIVQWFGWSPFILLFPNPAIPESILRWLYQEHQLKLV